MEFVTLRNAIDEVGEVSEIETIPLPNISIDTLKLCIDFARWLKQPGN